MREIIAGIDIGSSKVKLIVAEILNESFNVLCALDEESRGVEKGAIVEPSEVEYVIKKLLKKAYDILGVNISKVIVSVNEEQAEFKVGEASLTVNSEDKEVSAQDIVHVLQMSVKGQIGKEMDLVTVIPIMFKIDDQKTRIPKGMRGDSLSVKSVVVSVPKKDIYATAKVLEKCGLEIADIMIPSTGSYYAHKNESTDTTTGIVVDMGEDTTNISVFNKGIIINNLVVPIGGKNIDSDISFIYKIKEEDSKKLKENFALANKKNASSKEKETVINNNSNKITITQDEVSEVVMSRIRQMLNMIKNEINYLTKKEISYIIITGGLSELRDISLEVESVFGKCAYVGKSNIIGARDNKYASCIGMIKYFDNKLKLRDKDFSSFRTDDLETLSGEGIKKNTENSSILSKVFGIFFDNN